MEFSPKVHSTSFRMDSTHRLHRLSSLFAGHLIGGMVVDQGKYL